MRSKSLAIATLLQSAVLCAQSPLITGFTSNNGGSIGGALYFDLTAGPAGVQINGIDLNYSITAGTAVGVDIYLRAGSYQGFEATMSGWNLASTGTGASAGTDMQTPLNITPFCIPAGTLVGVALVAQSSAHRYTNGTGANQTAFTAELTLTAGSALNNPFIGAPITPRVPNISISYVTAPTCSLNLPPQFVAVIEATPFGGTMVPQDQFMTPNSFLRWNYNDVSGSYTDFPAITAVNFGSGGPAPTGVTPFIPGFNQVWAGSTPAGAAEVFIPFAVGGTDGFLTIPAGVFNLGDTMRMQGIVLDPSIPGPLPVVPTTNSVTLTYTDCLTAEGFDGLTTGVGVYPTGWSSGGGVREWSVQTGGTTSSSTGPTSAASGVNYAYCETSSPLQGDTFIMNTATYATSSLSSNTVDFFLSRIGATIGTLEVRLGTGNGSFPTVLATYTGAEPSGIEWTAESLALPTPVPANIQLQFLYTMGSSFTGDLAIDEICLR